MVEPTQLKNMLIKMGSSSPIFGVNIKNIWNRHFLEITSIAWPFCQNPTLKAMGQNHHLVIHHFLNGGWYTFRTNVCKDDPTSRAKKNLPNPNVCLHSSGGQMKVQRRFFGWLRLNQPIWRIFSSKFPKQLGCVNEILKPPPQDAG